MRSFANSAFGMTARDSLVVATRSRRRLRSLRLFGVVAATTLAASCADGSTAEASGLSRQRPADTLPCERAVAEGSAQPTTKLDPAYMVLLGRVALPTREALGASPSGDPDPSARLFAKAGLFIRPGAAFELVVPKSWRGRLSIAWGPMGRTARLRVAGCEPPPNTPRGSWIGFPGGYFAPDPACVSLVVKSGHRTARARIGVGVPC